MSSFLPGRLPCFICARTISARVDAARLFYAHPDDVGDVARCGRAWVHRGCWNAWPLRETWARSAARLLTGLEDVKTVSSGMVVCRFDERDVLLQDTWQAIEWSLPRAQLKEVLAAIGTTTSSRIAVKGVQWTFGSNEHGLEVTVEDETERFEVFRLEADTWRAALEQVPALRGP
jgi:hypothetical protein